MLGGMRPWNMYGAIDMQNSLLVVALLNEFICTFSKLKEVKSDYWLRYNEVLKIWAM